MKIPEAGKRNRTSLEIFKKSNMARAQSGGESWWMRPERRRAGVVGEAGTEGLQESPLIILRLNSGYRRTHEPSREEGCRVAI